MITWKEIKRHPAVEGVEVNKGRRGIGVAECSLHGEYFLDAKDSPCPDCTHHVARWDAEEKAKLAKEEVQTSPVEPYDPNDVPF